MSPGIISQHFFETMNSTLKTTSNDNSFEKELSQNDLSQIVGGIYTLPLTFAFAVYKGIKEIQHLQETGELPDRFKTPVPDVSESDEDSGDTGFRSGTDCGGHPDWGQGRRR